MGLAPVVYGESPVATAISLKNTGASQLTGVTITAVSGETDSFGHHGGEHYDQRLLNRRIMENRSKRELRSWESRSDASG